MEELLYSPSNVCAKEFKFEIKDDIIQSCTISGGCPGNLLGISKIIVGMSPKEVVESFSGVACGNRSTSCPNEIAKALSAYLEN